MRVDFLVRNGDRRDCHADALVLRKRYFRSEGQLRNEGETAIRMGGHILRHAEIKDVKGFLLERFVVSFIDERLVEFPGDFLFKTFLDNGARGLAGAETWNAGLAGIAFDDPVALAANFVRWDFNAKGGDALWLLLDNNVHNKWGRLRRRDGQPRGRARRLSNEACILWLNLTLP